MIEFGSDFWHILVLLRIHDSYSFFRAMYRTELVRVAGIQYTKVSTREAELVQVIEF